MPILLLLRHAKAEPGADDHERVLSDRGAGDAAAMGALIAQSYPGIDAVLCSTSARTRQTWDAVRKALKGSPEPKFLRDIYKAGGDYLEILRRHGGPAETLLLVGHNPTIQASAVALTASGGGEAETSLARKFPTGALAVLEFEGGWTDLRPGAALLRDFLLPPGSGRD